MHKTVIITGASGNLGKATVEKFVALGHTVITTVAPGMKLGFYEDHPQVEIHSLDLMNEPAVEDFVKQVIKQKDHIDAGLFLVGGYAGGSIRETDGNLLRKMYTLNFETAYFLARPMFNQMIKQRGGRLVFIGARPAVVPSQGINNLAYGFSKSLVIKLSEYLNAEGAEKNVVSSVIIPSTLDTPVNRRAMPDADFSSWVKPEDIANMLAFLISDESAAWREPVIKMYGNA